jgi:hypothetical protein
MEGKDTPAVSGCCLGERLSTAFERQALVAGQGYRLLLHSKMQLNETMDDVIAGPGLYGSW